MQGITMKPINIIGCVAALALWSPLLAQQQPAPAIPALKDMPDTDRLPGVDLAEGISQITGVAVSPMLGVSAIGAWRFFHTEDRLRADLPWFCQPMAWGTGLALLSLCFLKDLFGTAAPPLIKKPLDMIELLENKASALVASTAFVPFVAAQMSRHLEAPAVANATGQTEVLIASVVPLAVSSFDARLLIVPLAILSFLIVWMTMHAINVLIALCPFGFIDALFKLLKTGILATVVLAYILNPWLGAAVSLLLIFVAALLAPFAFRFSVFGTLLASDILLFRRARRHATPENAHAFVASRKSGMPKWTYGRVSCDEGGALQFTYRPWLMFPRRSAKLPEGALAVGKGVFFPTLLHGADASQHMRTMAIFLPRYRGQENALGDHLRITDIRDGTLMKGFKAAKMWLMETIDLGRSKLVAARSGV